MKALKSFQYVLSFVWKHQKSYVVVTLLSELMRCFEIFIAVYFPKIVIDSLILGRDTCQLIGIIAAFCMGLFLISIFASWTKYFIWKSQCVLQRKLICSVMQKTAGIDYENLEDPQILDMKKKAEASYLGNASEDFFGVIKYFFSIISSVISLMGLIAILSQLGILPLAFLNLVIVFNCFLEAKTLKKNFHLEEESIPYERRRQYYRDVPLDLKAIKEIKSFNLSSWIVGKFSDISKITTKYYTDALHNTCKTDRWCAFSILLRNIFSYMYVVIRVLRKAITIGDFSMYISAIENYSNIFKGVIQNLLQLSHVGMYVEYLQQYLNIPERIRNQGNLSIPEDMEAFEIEFRNVYFRYPHAKNDTLKNINLKIHNKEHISIVGENGAGKSTLIKLLCRLYMPTKGEILLNGVNINQYSLEEYNQLIAPVFQDFQLFSMSVEENLTMSGNWNEEKASQILQEVALGYLPLKYEKFYDRQVTKLFDGNGIVLSGGEQQKFAIARALYQKGHQIVVLDEPTAALDPRSEAEIYQVIDKLVEDKMSIFISHRLSSCKYCDNIVVLLDGSIAEYGSHEELTKKKGIYYELFELQAERYRD